jgi:small-conductance mechanosensitive channel
MALLGRRWRPRRRRTPREGADARAAGAAFDLARRPDFRVAVLAGVVVLAALVAGSTSGDLHGRSLHAKLLALGAALAVVIFGTVATRRLASTVAGAVSLRTGRSGATAVRLVITFAGYVVVVFAALGLLAVPVQHLILVGALTGVAVGIAAQQSLGNMFAGMVLLATRPFSIGDRIRIRAGALGSEFDGVVRNMSLTYVTVETDDGPLHVPNSGVLAAAVGPRARRPDVVTSASGSSAHADPRLLAPATFRHHRQQTR